MDEFSARMALLLGAAALWVAGLRLFLQSDLSRARKVTWTAFLVLVGTGIGLALPLDEVWRKFWLLLLVLPVLGLIDVLLLRSGRGLWFWIRACGFEVCTVFGTAGAVRFCLDLTGAAALLATGAV